MLRIILLAAALFALAPVGVASADVDCTVLEIEASKADAPSTDPDLKPLERKLKKPPLSSWNSFKRLGSSQVKLAPQQVGSVSLVHGKAGVLLREVNERAGKKPRVSLGITLDDTGGKRFIDTKVNVDAGDYFVVARPLPADKGHLVALTCKPTP